MNPVQISLMTIFHPMEGFNQIKSNREHFSYIPSLVIAVLYMVVRILSLYLMHYSVGSSNEWIDIPMEIAIAGGPAISWIVVHYAVTTISSGECKIFEVMASLLYAFVPYIILTLPITLLSHLYSAQSAGTINTLNTIVSVYCYFQVFISIKSMNDFTLKKTIGIIVITLIGIILCWVLVFLIYGLTGQLINTAVNLFIEFINVYTR